MTAVLFYSQRMAITYPYHSLEDFLTGSPASVDGTLNDGWGAAVPVKGREIEATVLFADITAFSRRTLDLTPVETLIFVNTFFSWMTAEALRGRPGIIDKYIGDELMVVFSTEFGSEDPFKDAMQAAHAMVQDDFLAYNPHIGIASGPVIVGYTGTPLRYSASVFGAPVAMAARCAGIKSDAQHVTTSIACPAHEWEGRDLDDVVAPRLIPQREGPPFRDSSWALLEPRDVELKNLPATSVRELAFRGFKAPMQDATDRAREGRAALEGAGRYWPASGG